MKEFEHKRLHGILACGANLHMCKIRNSGAYVTKLKQFLILPFECKQVEFL